MSSVVSFQISFFDYAYFLLFSLAIIISGQLKIYRTLNSCKIMNLFCITFIYSVIVLIHELSLHWWLHNYQIYVRFQVTFYFIWWHYLMTFRPMNYMLPCTYSSFCLGRLLPSYTMNCRLVHWLSYVPPI